MKSLARSRLIAATTQSHRCYYCGSPVWLHDPDHFAARHRLSARQTRLLRCTAEHLTPKSDGGGDGLDNIVAACQFCNQHRHRTRLPLSPADYRSRVARAMRQGRWIAGVLSRQ